jgi:hypothetical protein
VLALCAVRRYGRRTAFADEVPDPMLRISLIDILMFALPFLLYGAYVLVTRGAPRSAAPADLWQGAPVVWLLAAGGVLLLITMATLISFSGGKPGGTYHPPSLQNGVIKPGEID